MKGHLPSWWLWWLLWSCACGSPFASADVRSIDAGFAVDVVSPADVRASVDVDSGADVATVDANVVDDQVELDAPADVVDAAPPWLACEANYERGCIGNPVGCAYTSVCTACPGACD